MRRLSSYFILSDRLKNGGYAVLSGLSGAIELINESLYESFQQLIQTGNPHELYIDESRFPSEIIETYQRRGLITELCHEDEKTLLKRYSAILHEHEKANPSLIIVPDLDCNYRCVYCFEKSMQTKLKSKRTTLSTDEVDAIYTSIEQLFPGTDITGKRITLFGGEPLLSKNRDLVNYIIEKGKEKGIGFAAVTNGHDLNEYIPLLGEGQISYMQITIDGPKDIHDRRRIALDKSSSFDKIIENLRRVVLETEAQITIRVNLDKENYDGFRELLGVFEGEGWLNNSRIFVNAAIVYKTSAGEGAIPQHDINSVRANLIDLTSAYSNVEIGCPQSTQRDMVFSSLTSNSPYTLRSSYCGASCGMYIFLPGGKITSCWETINDECSCVGSYSENGLVLDEESLKHRFGRSAAEIPACADCRYCLVCSGGCSQFAEFETGSIYAPFCDGFPETYPWVLADAVENFLKLGNL